MRNRISRIYPFCVFIAICITQCYALYEDQIGKFDWKQKYVGWVNKAYFDGKSSGRKIIVTTEKNVIAALDPRDGSIIWRQVYELGSAGRIDAVYQNNDIVTLSGGGKFLRSWDTNTGSLSSEVLIPFPVKKPSTNCVYGYVEAAKKVFRVELHVRSHASVTAYDLKDESFNNYDIAAGWLNQNSRCLITSKAMLFCVDAQSKSFLVSSLLGEKTTFKSFQFQEVNFVPGKDRLKFMSQIAKDLVVVDLDSDLTIVMQIKDSEVKIIQQFNKVVALDVFAANDHIIVVTMAARHTYEIKTYSLDTMNAVESLCGQFLLPEHTADVSMVKVHTFGKRDGTLSYRLLISTKDHALIMINQSGKQLWLREEALASVLSVEMLELPVSDTEARFEEEFGSVDSNIVKMFFKRLLTQLIQLKTIVNDLVVHVMSGQVASRFSGIVPIATNTKLERDEFNLHKMIVVATSSGKFFGIDNLSGSILWRKWIPNIDVFDNERLPMFVQRTTAHFPHRPQCVVLAKNKLTSTSMLYVFEPITGEPIKHEGSVQDGVVDLRYDVVQASLVPTHDDHFLKPLLLLDSSEQAHSFPDSAKSVIIGNADKLFVFAANVTTGVIAGYGLKYSTPQKLIATRLWRTILPRESQKITHVATKRSVERVHSQGRVMGDRSVLYKYLNPNLAAIVTEGRDSNQKSYINVYLIDGVTGHIVHGVIHRRAHGPVHIIHSENWVVYSYYNEKSRRTDLTVLEMYEGKTQSNTTVFSSLHPPLLPIVDKQSYVFPLSGINAMVDTITEKGITSKHILIAMPSGGVLEVPKFFIDPRRPLVMTPELREEGVMPYIPELPLPSEHIINYNQSVSRIRNIHTAPAGLESTCLVLVYGLDLFYTRITPSKTFDVLKDDFDHYFISLVLFGLITASYVTKRLAAHKALKQAWK